MRRLGPVHNVLRAAITLGAQVEATTNNVESTKEPSLWAKIWNEQDVRIMVLISLALQLFLLFAGNVRRWRRVGWLRFLMWLAYLAAYAVAASAVGLFSQYEDKYKLRSLESTESSEDLHTVMMPFLWAPFLLLHLGGPDTITAFSIEDNNLWTRQILNLVVQLSLALYVFWKSHDLLDAQLVAVAVPLFVAGIIKYGERIWALKTGTRDGLDCHAKKKEPTGSPPGDAVESRVHNSALWCRGLLVGRTLWQLGSAGVVRVLKAFDNDDPAEVKLKFVLMELGMIYDMIYTKAMVLQSRTGGVFRCVGLVAMVVAFVLFWVFQHLYAQRTTNADITYTLFAAAIFVELYSIFMVIASPWTRARFKVLRWLSEKLAFFFPSQGLPSSSMGQFNLTDYCLSKKSTPEFISKVSEASGLAKHWRNFWHVKHAEDKDIVSYIVGLLNTDPDSLQLELGMELMFLLTLPFEHTLFRLHIFTEMYLSKLDGGGSGDGVMTELAAQCRKLSNYLLYLMAVYPSMLPVGSAAQDLESSLAEWIRKNHGNLGKVDILNNYASSKEFYIYNNVSPFKEHPSVESLKEMKEVWARLLIYAAGKGRMELHARQLGNGVGLLTVVGSLMMHHFIGVVGRKLDLLAPPGAPTQNSMVVVHENASMHPVRSSVPLRAPLYAFEFLDHSDGQLKYVRAWERHDTHKVAQKLFTTYTANVSPIEFMWGSVAWDNHATHGEPRSTSTAAWARWWRPDHT